MGRPRLKAEGQRGSWFATVEGENLPCCHKYFVKGLLYHDPEMLDSLPQAAALVQAIQDKKKIILTNDNIISKDPLIVFSRTGYIAIFRVDNVEWRGNALTFTLVERLADLV